MLQYVMDLDNILNKIDSDLFVPFGRIVSISGTTIRAWGLEVAIGDIVRIESATNLYTVLGMVATISKNNFTIIPFSFIDSFKIEDKVCLQKDGLSILVIMDC